MGLTYHLSPDALPGLNWITDVARLLTICNINKIPDYADEDVVLPDPSKCYLGHIQQVPTVDKQGCVVVMNFKLIIDMKTGRKWWRYMDSEKVYV